jgi:hypothetical protein
MMGEVPDIPVLHDILDHVILLVVPIERFLLLRRQLRLLIQLNLKGRERGSIILYNQSSKQLYRVYRTAAAKKIHKILVYM